ncbi:META domain-containing protein [Halochromatium sp.]
MTDLRALSLICLLLVAIGPAIAESDKRTISGQLSYLQRIALTPDSIAVVEFRDADGQLQGETRFASDGRQVPLPFALQIPVDTSGQLRGAIWRAGRPAWVSDRIAIAAGEQPLELGTLRLQPITPTDFTTLMRCGETELEIAVSDDHARLRLNDQTLELSSTPAASGSKFVAQDDSDTFFWSKGNRALVSIAGETLPECLAAVPAQKPGDKLGNKPGDKTTFKARGNEPGWTLEIRGDQLRLVLDYGTREIETKLPAPVSTDDVKQYRLPEQDLSIRITEHRCNDSMTGMPYPKTVVLELEDRRLTGCGGEPSELLRGDAWTVRSLAGKPVPDEVSVRINFLEDNGVAGNSGCNRFMGQYELTGEGLSFGQLASTMMACPEPQMQVEPRFLGLLQAVNRFEMTPEGGLLLITSEGERISAER